MLPAFVLLICLNASESLFLDREHIIKKHSWQFEARGHFPRGSEGHTLMLKREGFAIKRMLLFKSKIPPSILRLQVKDLRRSYGKGKKSIP
ncbi:hypothetical protein EX87_01475 [Brevibacillus laterosporus]|uniref:Uncharacterized protein n=1 Tax=Brevibacillus laterosporus TaxID=1465 RepID=A0A0F7BYP2_BRELA|nr:hypothetical protein EX87_01475 [Brevibacillus laterosporus]